jgi:quinol monooxygenase YgiN
MPEEIHIFATLIAQEGQEAALGEALKELVTGSRGEPGNLHYMLHTELDKPGSFHVFECYKDKAAVDAHMQSPHFAACFSKAKTLLAGRPTIIQTSLIAGD